TQCQMTAKNQICLDARDGGITAADARADTAEESPPPAPAPLTCTLPTPCAELGYVEGSAICAARANETDVRCFLRALRDRSVSALTYVTTPPDYFSCAGSSVVVGPTTKTIFVLDGDQGIVNESMNGTISGEPMKLQPPSYFDTCLNVTVQSAKDTQTMMQ